MGVCRNPMYHIPTINLYKLPRGVILMGMDIDKFIETHYTLRVNEDKNGMKVLFVPKAEGVLEENVVWFERAKKGWSKKPIYQNNFIIVDAHLSPLLEFMHSYLSLDESDYPNVRRTLVEMSITTIDNYFKGD